MSPSYEPLFAPVCVFLALGAVPVAAIVRSLGGDTAHSTLPVGWSSTRTLGAVALIALIAVGIELLPMVLLPLSDQLLADAPHAQPAGSPGWLVALGSGLVVGAAELAWRLALLTAPLSLGLIWITHLRWPRTWLTALAALMAAPVPLWVLGRGLPSTEAADWTRLVIALAVFGTTLLVVVRRQRLLRRWHAWRQPKVEVTRVSALPGHMAARMRMESMEARTRPVAPPSMAVTVKQG